MKYIVFVIEENIYKWEIKADSDDDAEYVVKQLFTVAEEREEHLLEKKVRFLPFLEKGSQAE